MFIWHERNMEYLMSKYIQTVKACGISNGMTYGISYTMSYTMSFTMSSTTYVKRPFVLPQLLRRKSRAGLRLHWQFVEFAGLPFPLQTACANVKERNRGLSRAWHTGVLTRADVRGREQWGGLRGRAGSDRSPGCAQGSSNVKITSKPL
jgi:hypothetical protein